jgi:hypothetical protein
VVDQPVGEGDRPAEPGGQARGRQVPAEEVDQLGGRAAAVLLEADGVDPVEPETATHETLRHLPRAELDDGVVSLPASAHGRRAPVGSADPRLDEEGQHAQDATVADRDGAGGDPRGDRLLRQRGG